MKSLFGIMGLMTVLVLAGCAVCKSTDSVEVCRTKQRNHEQGNSSWVAPAADGQRS